MAVCVYCDQEMLDGLGCAVAEYGDFADGVSRARVPYPADAGRLCHDCRVPPGALHHPGCDDERCPRCGGQAIACGCSDVDFEASRMVSP